MMLFLQIVGAIFVSMVLVIVFFTFWIKWRIRSAFKELGQSVKEMGATLEALKASGGVPPRINVVRAGEVGMPAQFADAQKESAYVRALLAQGFTDLGYYLIQEMPNVIMHGLMNVEQATYALVFEMPGVDVGVVLDLVCGYPDGTSMTYSTSPETGLERPPGKPIVREPGSPDAAGLYARYLRERPPGPFLPVSADDFPRRIEKAHAEEQDWRNSRGGVSEKEIRRIAARLGGEGMDDFTIQLARHVEATRAASATADAVKERFYASAGWSAERQEEEGDALHVVHETTPLDEVVATYLEAADPGTEGDEWDKWREGEDASARRLVVDLPPRRAFEMLNARLPVEKQFKRLGEVSEPVAADVYRPPASLAE